VSDITTRLSPGIRELEPLDRMDIFRQVVERADFGSGDTRLGALVVGDHRVCWKVEGTVVAIGLAEEFSAPRIPDDA
jgi:hypothetical protein